MDVSAVTCAGAGLPPFLDQVARVLPGGAALTVCRTPTQTRRFLHAAGTALTVPVDDRPEPCGAVDRWGDTDASGGIAVAAPGGGPAEARDRADDRDDRVDARQVCLDEREILLDELQRRLDEQQVAQQEFDAVHRQRAQERDAVTADRQLLADARERLLDERQQTLIARSEQVAADAAINAAQARRLHAIKDGLDRRIAVAELQEWLMNQPPDPNPDSPSTRRDGSAPRGP